MTFGTSQAMSTVAVLPVMCTGLPNSHIAGGIGLPVLCPKLGRASKSRRKTFEKLRVATWNMGSMKGKVENWWENSGKEK